MDALKDAAHEADCMGLDLADAITHAKTTDKLADHLNEAIRRHALIGAHLRNALTQVARRRGTLSMVYPKSLGGGHGPDRASATGAAQ